MRAAVSVIIGGGIIGATIAYQLDCLASLIQQKQAFYFLLYIASQQCLQASLFGNKIFLADGAPFSLLRKTQLQQFLKVPKLIDVRKHRLV